MKANPGGIISPNEVLGRDRLIERLWKTLEQQSVILVAERRMGKTSVIKKMAAEHTKGNLVIFMDVEAVSRIDEFMELLVSAFSAQSNTQKATEWLKYARSTMSGFEVAGVKIPGIKVPPWKTLLERLFKELIQTANCPVIFIWDEFPWMLQKITRNEGHSTVVDLLDLLRSMRQTHQQLRVIYTGSIGLHHVVTSLHDEGYIHAPTNDMRTIELPPLEPQDATTLASSLLKGERLSSEHDQDSAELITRLVEGVPYYIHHVVARLADANQPLTLVSIEEVVTQGLIDPNDPWNLEHYRLRLGEYYGERAGLARSILNILAENQPMDLDDLREHLKTDFQPNNETSRRIVEGDREQLRRLIKLMQRDHYLAQDTKGCYGFRFNLIHRWWRLDLGLI